jgi:pSer/pThr/pTyr-binding forkhead associated (FHA) protein
VPKTECLVGRRNPYKPPDVDLFPDDKVSRRHARIWIDNGAAWVEDLGSRHGTLVNGVKINYALQLSLGDTIQVGETLLGVELD